MLRNRLYIHWEPGAAQLRLWRGSSFSSLGKGGVLGRRRRKDAPGARGWRDEAWVTFPEAHRMSVTEIRPE